MISVWRSTIRRRAAILANDTTVQYRWDDFLIDLDAFTLHRAGKPVALEPKAFDLLVLVIQRPGHLFTKQELFDAVWPGVAVTDHALTRVVAQLRRALGDDVRDARYIETVPTRGYRWIPRVEVAAAAPIVEVGDAPQPPPATPRRPASMGRFVPAAAVLVVLLAAVVGLVWWTGGGAETSADANGSAWTAADPGRGSVAWPVQITSHNGLDLQPAFSPQGDALAFVSDRSGSLEIYVRALHGGSAEVALTSDGGQNVQPAWSPDGRFIAYHSYRGGIWVIPARGGVSRQVAPAGANPAWSPDGSRIAFQSDEHADVTPSAFGAQSGSTIAVVNVDGTNLREVTRAGQPLGGHALPVWTPDGRRIAFSVFDASPDHEIWTIPAEGGAATRLHVGKGFYELAFAPNGSALYAAGGEALIVRVPFDQASGAMAGPATYIPIPGVPGARGLTISPDGRQLAFSGLALDSQIWQLPVAVDGTPTGTASPLTSDTSRRTSMPAISPDGSKVAYMSARRGERPNIWVMDIGGQNRVQVTSDPRGSAEPHWLPDGRRLAFRSGREELDTLWLVDIATRRVERLLDGGHRGEDGAKPGLPWEMRLAPSGSKVAFSVVSPPAGRRILFVSPIERFAPREVTDGTRSIGYPAWSPDEQRLAVEVKDGSSTHAAVIDLSTGKVTELSGERGQTWVRSWSPDGRRIVVAASRDGLWSLQAIDAATGARQVMRPADLPRVYVRYPDWSPRGGMVAYERGELRGNIWMLRVDQPPR